MDEQLCLRRVQCRTFSLSCVFPALPLLRNWNSTISCLISCSSDVLINTNQTRPLVLLVNCCPNQSLAGDKASKFAFELHGYMDCPQFASLWKRISICTLFQYHFTVRFSVYYNLAYIKKNRPLGTSWLLYFFSILTGTFRYYLLKGSVSVFLLRESNLNATSLRSVLTI